MATKLQISNRALVKIGELRVAALTDDTENARLLNANYEDDKRAVLERHSWKFARAQVELAQNATAPLNGYTLSYELPTDFIRMVYFNNTNPLNREVKPFTIVDQQLQTDETSAKITYIKDVTSPGLFSPLFVEALSTYMALNLCYARTQSQPLMDRLEARFARDLSAAKASDSAGDHTPPPSRLGFPSIAARFRY